MFDFLRNKLRLYVPAGIHGFRTHLTVAAILKENPESYTVRYRDARSGKMVTETVLRHSIDIVDVDGKKSKFEPSAPPMNWRKFVARQRDK